MLSQCVCAKCARKLVKKGLDGTGMQEKNSILSRKQKGRQLKMRAGIATTYASGHVWADADILRHATAEPPHGLPRKLPGSTCAQGPSALTATGRTPVFDEENTTSRKQDMEEGIKSVS